MWNVTAARALFLSSLCLFVFLPLEAMASRCRDDGFDWREAYEDKGIYAIATVRNVRYDAETNSYIMDVIRSWKAELSGSIVVFNNTILLLERSYFDYKKGVYLVFLSRDITGRLRVEGCRGGFHESDSKFSVYLRLLEQLSTCACENLDEQGWYDRADAIVLADAVRIVEQGTKKFAELEVWLAWKSELPNTLTVLTEDSRSGCGYPVMLAPEARYLLLYLRRNENGEYTTGYCSGNLQRSMSSDKRIRWLTNHIPYTKDRLNAEKRYR